MSIELDRSLWIDGLFQKYETLIKENDLSNTDLNSYMVWNVSKLKPNDCQAFFARAIKHPQSEKVIAIFCNSLRESSHIDGMNEYISSHRDDRKFTMTLLKNLACWEQFVVDQMAIYEITDEKDRIAIAESSLSNEKLIGLNAFENFQINNQLELVRLAKKAIEMNPIQTLHKFSVFGIHDKKCVAELGQYAALCDDRLNKKSTHSWVQHFETKPESELIEILKEGAKSDGYRVALWIPFAPIKDQKALAEIAEIAIRQNLSAADIIYHFGIEDYVVMAELYKLTIRLNKYYLMGIKDFRIKDQAIRIELAKFAATLCPSSVANHIGKFEINDEEARIDIARVIIHQAPYAICSFFHKFKIESQAVRIEMALSIAKVSPAISYSIHEFDVPLETRIKVAELVIENSPVTFSQSIKIYGFADESIRIRLAKLVATHPRSNLAVNFSFFQISEEKDRFEVAKIAVKYNSDDVKRYFKEFGITNQSHCIEIAKIGIEEDPNFSASFFGDFGIEDENERIGLAKLLAVRNGGDVSHKIRYFSITNQIALKEIALLAARQNGRKTSEYIDDYKIKDENARIEVAFAAGDHIESEIGGYKITSELVKYKIAKNAIEKGDPSKIIHNFIFWGINDERLRIKIGKIAARRNGPDVIEGLASTLKITDKKIVFKILLMAIQNSEETFNKLETFSAGLNHELIPIFNKLADDNPSLDPILDQLQKIAVKYLREIPWIETIKKNQNLQAKKSLVCWLAYTVALCVEMDIGCDASNWIEKTKCMEAILDYREPQIRYHLSHCLIKIATSPRKRRFYDNLQSRGSTSTTIPALVLTLLKLKNIERFKNKELDNPLTLRPMIRALLTVLNEKKLSKDDRSHILRNVFQSDSLSENIQLLKLYHTIIRFDGIEKIKNNQQSKSSLELQTIVSELFQNKIPVKEIPDFFNKYQLHFGNFRYADALLVYASGINRLRDQKLLIALAQFVETVLEGSFYEERYVGSIHLDRVFKDRAELLQEWKKGAVVPLVIGKEENTNEPIDFFKILKRSVIEYGHLGQDKFPFLKGFLKDEKGMLEGIGKALRTCEKGSVASNILLFERHCIRLAKSGLSLVEQKTEFKKMKEYFQSSINLPNFAVDIRDMEEALSGKTHDYEGWTVVDTDNYEDLFLCGTEVLGSCQIINGDPELNKCLLGYVMDGKNRVIAVKNSEGKIMARCILRVLWDSENLKPVLFMERFYPSVVKSVISEGLLGLVRQRAVALGLDLTTNDGLGVDYNGSVESLSSTAPYEYCDAGPGRTDGVYKIRNVKRVCTSQNQIAPCLL